jgi:hypothetical protein
MWDVVDHAERGVNATGVSCGYAASALRTGSGSGATDAVARGVRLDLRREETEVVGDNCLKSSFVMLIPSDREDRKGTF